MAKPGMVEARCFVQFIHPGGEHAPDQGNVRTWNQGPHRRKFLTCPGITELDRREQELVFWGEWEPPSEVVEEIDRPLKNGPRYIYRPYWIRPHSFRGLQNTDPFVFDGFYYSICKQTRSTGRTQLRYLEPGSVILFGSHLRGEFVLDTVFVVKGHVDHTNRNYCEVLHGKVPEHYPTVALAPFYASRPRDAQSCADATELRLYFGATVDDPVDGMFSYFPCQAYRPRSRGFARPRIRLPGIVNPASLQANRLNRGTDPGRFPSLWRRRQVRPSRRPPRAAPAGRALRLRAPARPADLPPRRCAAPAPPRHTR